MITDTRAATHFSVNLTQFKHIGADNPHFNPGDKIAMRGNRVDAAHVVLSGSVNVSDGENDFNCGPGSVIGLAEGLAGLPHSFTVIAKNTVTTRLILMEDARHAIAGINAGLRGIFRAAIVRTLGLNAIPEALK